MSVVQGVEPAKAADQKVPGVVVEGPLVDAKFRDSYAIFAFMFAGTIGAVIWIFTYGIGWIEISVFLGMFSFTTIGLGVAMHRLFVHRSFHCGPIMRAVFAAAATMVVQGSILKWVSNHRRHHLLTDKPGDVHSPHYDGFGNRYLSFAKGMLHAQTGWIWDQATTDADYWAKDIVDDPISMFFTRTRWFWYALSTVLIPGALGYALGGVHAMIGCVLFSGLFRSYVMTIATSLVNSFCHAHGRYGYRRFEVDDASTNNLLVSLVTFGEGLHNNHHRFQRDAYLSHAWYEIDINGLIILGLEKIGLVHDVFRVPRGQLERSTDGGVAAV
jgi:stearoyl-CoA desaturase (delta-9 desaturase)